MATPTQLFSDRDTAGAAYVTAVAALRTAWINLRALDIACSSKRVVGSLADGATRLPVQTFPNVSEYAGRPLLHPAYSALPDVTSWHQTAEGNALTLLNALS